jgi:hypothetical protein
VIHRHNFSRWIADVFRDGPLAARVRGLEAGIEGETPPSCRYDRPNDSARYERIA